MPDLKFKYFSVDELLIFLNHLFRSDIRSFSVNDPFFNSTLFEIMINQEIKIKLANGYTQNKSRHTNIAELPDENIFADLLTQSGAIEYKNATWLTRQIQKEFNRNPLSGDRLIYFSFDTNLLRDRFFTNFFRPLAEKSHQRVGFVIPDLIKKELSIGNKYSVNEPDFKVISQLLLQNNFILKNFINQHKLIDRQHYLGMQELFKIQKFGHCEIINTKNGKKHDEQIISTLAEFSSKRNVDIAIFSRDKDFDQLRGYPGLSYKRINRIYPNLIPKKFNCSWSELCQLLYVSAINFGAIRLVFPQDATADLYGIWSGKGPVRWENEEIKIESHIPELNNSLIDLNIIKKSKKECSPFQNQKYIYRN